MAEALDVSLEQFRKDRVVAVFDDDFVMDAQEVARKNGIHHLVVMHGKGLVGVVCTCDMLHVPPDTKVGSLMHTPATLPVSAGTLKAASLMDTAHVGSVLLLDQGLPCGIVTRGEIFRVDPKTAQAAGLSRCNCCGGTSHIQQFSEQGALCVYCAARFGKSLS